MALKKINWDGELETDEPCGYIQATAKASNGLTYFAMLHGDEHRRPLVEARRRVQAMLDRDGVRGTIVVVDLADEVAA